MRLKRQIFTIAWLLIAAIMLYSSSTVAASPWVRASIRPSGRRYELFVAGECRIPYPGVACPEPLLSSPYPRIPLVMPGITHLQFSKPAHVVSVQFLSPSAIAAGSVVFLQTDQRHATLRFRRTQVSLKVRLLLTFVNGQEKGEEDLTFIAVPIRHLQPRLCSQSAAPGSPPGEPFTYHGATELVSGLFLNGGPLRRSAKCRPGVPSAGTITVTSTITGSVVASDNVSRGHLARIPLAPGVYTITGTFATAFSNNQPIQARPEKVTISAGTTVRQDIDASIR